MSNTVPPAPAPANCGAATGATDNDPAIAAATAVSTTNDEEPIPPPPSSGGRAGYVFHQLGLPYRDDRIPVHGAVKKVWDNWAFSTGKLSWYEVPEENRLALEEQLRKELETLFTEPEHIETARRIRRCQEWLPRFLLAEKHRLRKRGGRKPAGTTDYE